MSSTVIIMARPIEPAPKDSHNASNSYNADDPKYPFDVAKANKILDDAGYAHLIALVEVWQEALRT